MTKESCRRLTSPTGSRGHFGFRISDFADRSGRDGGRRRSLAPGRDRAASRAGFTLVELTISAMLLAAVMLTAIPTLAWISRARQAAERRQAAVLAVGNLMERVTALPWDDITPDVSARFALPEDLAKRLPEADLRITVVSVSGAPHAKRVLIELRWQETPAGIQSAPVRLAAWVYRHDREVS